MVSQREGRYGFTQGRIMVHVNGRLWVLNQEQYQFGYLSIMLLFLVKHVTRTYINRLFAYCKGGNFNIHIWAWFGYFIC